MAALDTRSSHDTMVTDDQAWPALKARLDETIFDDRPLHQSDLISSSLAKRALRYVINHFSSQFKDFDFDQPNDIDAMDLEGAWESIDLIFKHASENKEEDGVATKEQDVEDRSSEESKKSGEGSAGSVEADRDRDREHE